MNEYTREHMGELYTRRSINILITNALVYKLVYYRGACIIFAHTFTPLNPYKE